MVSRLSKLSTFKPTLTTFAGVAKKENKKAPKFTISIGDDVEMPDIYVGASVIRNSYNGLRYLNSESIKKFIPSEKNLGSFTEALSYIKVIHARSAQNIMDNYIKPIMDEMVDYSIGQARRSIILNDLSYHVKELLTALKPALFSRKTSIYIYGYDWGHQNFIDIYKNIIEKILFLIRSETYAENIIQNSDDFTRLFIELRRLKNHLESDVQRHSGDWKN